MTSTRRPATAADLTVGTVVYKGNGKVALRVSSVEFSAYYGETVAQVVKVTPTGKTNRSSLALARELTIAA